MSVSIYLDIGTWWHEFWPDLQEGFHQTFIEENRYQSFLQGLSNTLLIAIAATCIGCAIGVLIACTKVAYSNVRTQKGLLRVVLWPFNFLCNVYLTIMRGTPVVVPRVVLYYVLLRSTDGLLVAMLGFGLNSGAYVAEIVRAGIMAVDPGQREAGRSLGLSSFTTMGRIILPQAVKNILPALGNEFITLLKETSVAGMITVMDLTRAADLVRSRTADAYFSLLSTALVYLLLVVGITAILNRVERRLRKSDRR